jgi:hypothetical protein
MQGEKLGNLAIDMQASSLWSQLLGNLDSVPFENLYSFSNVVRARGNFTVEGREHFDSATAPPCDLQNLGATRAKFETMDSARREMNQCARYGQPTLSAETELYIPLDDEEGFVPTVAMRGRPISFVTVNKRNRIISGRRDFGQDVYLVAHHVERRRIVFRVDRKWLFFHEALLQKMILLLLR